MNRANAPQAFTGRPLKRIQAAPQGVSVATLLAGPLRRQLRKMGDTGQMRLPAGTYGRDVLDRLLIDLAWASSHLEGNTYSRLDTRKLIEYGQAA